MLEKRLAGHLFTEVRESVGIHVQIRLVDLEYVTGKYHFGTFAGTGYYGLDFVRGEILCFVYNEIHFSETPAPDVCERGYEKFFFVQHRIDPVGLPAALPETTGIYVRYGKDYIQRQLRRPS